ncbi:uncharacterized protein A4U43_C07F27110 [Asparagus officinalis]|uniref:Uncharacterized protein n=1 Tax=Asparagus officinalis TaxID=4686 RepID=A0A5P1EF63_ASPOF|nr:uncharacterized protein A4U43_C07F27110 [Asparagus officinalis]
MDTNQEELVRIMSCSAAAAGLVMVMMTFLYEYQHGRLRRQRTGKSSCANKRRQVVGFEDVEVMSTLVDKMDEIALHLKMSIKSGVKNYLRMSMLLVNFPRHVLDHVLDYLYDDERLARLFIVKPLDSKVAWIDNHVVKYDLDANGDVDDDIVECSNEA